MNIQATLFETPPDKTYAETYHERMYKLATSPEVIDAMVAVLREKQGEFVSFHMACWDLWHQINLGSYINDSLHYMVRRGMLEEKRVYHGATSPSSAPTKKTRGKQAPLEKPYLGYQCLYRLKEAE
jgi:hypothetical protein